MFQVVPNAISEWQLALNVKRANGPIRLNRKCANNQYFLVDEDPNEQVILLVTGNVKEIERYIEIHPFKSFLACLLV